MKIAFQMLQQLYRRVFQGNKPSPKVKPQRVGANKSIQKQEQAQPQSKAEPKEDQSTFWQDKLDADAADKKQAFYEKYRSRLQNQDPDISPKH